jgi:hypothetical protein
MRASVFASSRPIDGALRSKRWFAKKRSAVSKVEDALS